MYTNNSLFCASTISMIKLGTSSQPIVDTLFLKWSPLLLVIKSICDMNTIWNYKLEEQKQLINA